MCKTTSPGRNVVVSSLSLLLVPFSKYKHEWRRREKKDVNERHVEGRRLGSVEGNVDGKKEVGKEVWKEGHLKKKEGRKERKEGQTEVRN